MYINPCSFIGNIIFYLPQSEFIYQLVLVKKNTISDRYESSKPLQILLPATNTQEIIITNNLNDLNATRQKRIHDRDEFWNNYDPYLISDEISYLVG